MYSFVSLEFGLAARIVLRDIAVTFSGKQNPQTPTYLRNAKRKNNQKLEHNVLLCEIGYGLIHFSSQIPSTDYELKMWIS